MIRLVGSKEVLVAVTTLLDTSARLLASDADRVQLFKTIAEFETAARSDLGQAPFEGIEPLP